jgi:hypothetical protein
MNFYSIRKTPKYYLIASDYSVLPLACILFVFQALEETDSVHGTSAAQRSLSAQEKDALILSLAKAEADDHGSRTDDATDTRDGVSSWQLP